MEGYLKSFISLKKDFQTRDGFYTELRQDIHEGTRSLLEYEDPDKPPEKDPPSLLELIAKDLKDQWTGVFLGEVLEGDLVDIDVKDDRRGCKGIRTLILEAEGGYEIRIRSNRTGNPEDNEVFAVFKNIHLAKQFYRDTRGFQGLNVDDNYDTVLNQVEEMKTSELGRYLDKVEEESPEIPPSSEFSGNSISGFTWDQRVVKRRA